MPTPQFITNEKGKKLAVVLTIKDHNKLMEQLEDLEDIIACNKALKNSDDKRMLFDDYLEKRKSTLEKKKKKEKL